MGSATLLTRDADAQGPAIILSNGNIDLDDFAALRFTEAYEQISSEEEKGVRSRRR
jgi:hypothetical protein